MGAYLKILGLEWDRFATAQRVPSRAPCILEAIAQYLAHIR